MYTHIRTLYVQHIPAQELGTKAIIAEPEVDIREGDLVAGSEARDAAHLCMHGSMHIFAYM